MNKRNGLTTGLAIAGTVLVLLPLIAPVFFAVLHFIRSRQVRVDYLMPAELFLVALAGGVLLIWASIRARQLRRWIGWSLAAAVLLLFGSQLLAILTGLASGEIEASGWQWSLVIGMLAGYSLALIGLFIGGVLLLRCLFSAENDTNTIA